MDLSSDLFTNLIAFISILISLSTVILYLRDRRNAKFLILSGYSNLLLDWYGETIEILIKLRLYIGKDCDLDKTDLLAKLSSQIEKGRFFFPNIDLGDDFGRNKPMAYVGYRNLAIDFLVCSYNLFESQDSKKFLKHAELLQREFTSIVYEVLRPKENLKPTCSELNFVSSRLRVQF